VSALGERGNNERWDASGRSPAVTPPGPRWGRYVVPETAVLVISDDYEHPRPLWPAPQAFENFGDMRVPAQQIGISGMLIEASDRLIEHHCRKSARIDVAQQILTVLETLLAVRGAWGKPREIIEGLMVRLEIDRVVLTRVDYRAFLPRWPATVGDGRIPAARVPCPADALCRQRFADRPVRLWRQGKAEALGAFGVRQVQRAIVCRGNAARLIWWLRCVDGEAIGRDLTTEPTGVSLHRAVAGGPRLLLQPAVSIQARTHLRRGILEGGRAGADEVLVVKVGAAERSHEEVVGKRELLGPLP